MILAADARLGMSAEVIVQRRRRTLLGATFLQHHNPLARLIWLGVAPHHRRAVGPPRVGRTQERARVVDRDAAIAVLDRLHEAQSELYAGGAGAALERLLAPDVTWTVPGDNAIAGTYRGLDEVLGYRRRRTSRTAHSA